MRTALKPNVLENDDFLKSNLHKRFCGVRRKQMKSLEV
jgi:hypothetical protein